jgi:hypothetical protein
MERRDVLKILSAAPFLGLRSAPQASPARAPRAIRGACSKTLFLSGDRVPLGGIGTERCRSAAAASSGTGRSCE